MKGLVRFALNVVANAGVVLLCPLLVLAWIVRVRMHERRGRARAPTGMLDTRLDPVTEAKPAWTMFDEAGVKGRG